MNKTTEVAIIELKNFFEFHTDLYMWVMQYGISHSVMALWFHTGNYPYGVEVICGGCESFFGNLQAGPYTLNILQEHDSVEDEVWIVIHDRQNQIKLTCSRLSIQRIRREEYTKWFSDGKPVELK